MKEFVATFPGHAVCDLTKQHLSRYMAARNGVAPKTRNERRNVVRMFLKWAVRQDYLSPSHRLLESDALAHEQADTEEISFYTSKELRLLLDAAATKIEFKRLLPVIALGGLAGVRPQEIIRLTWEDIFRVPGQVEISKNGSPSNRTARPTLFH